MLACITQHSVPSQSQGNICSIHSVAPPNHCGVLVVEHTLCRQFLRTPLLSMPTTPGGQGVLHHLPSLQGTKACLGWDRESQGGTHACTAVVDLWLQLLQRTLHLSQKLPRGPSGPVSRQGSLSEGLDPAMDIRSQVGTLVKSYRASLQELMTQLLVHWKVMLSTHQAA